MTPVTTRVRDISVCPPTDTSSFFAFTRAENQASNYELTWPLLFAALSHVSSVLLHPPTVSQLAPGRVAAAAVRVGTMGPVDRVVVSGGGAVGGRRVRSVRRRHLSSTVGCCVDTCFPTWVDDELHGRLNRRLHSNFATTSRRHRNLAASDRCRKSSARGCLINNNKHGAKPTKSPGVTHDDK